MRSNQNDIKERADAICRLIGNIDGPIVGAEIGVWKAELSCTLLDWLPELRLYLVDPWGRNREYTAMGSLTEQAWYGVYFDVQQAVRPYCFRTKVMKAYSLEAAMWVPDESLDFVFIDGDHSYASVMADIEAWTPKLKPGGVLCGHDYGVVSGVTQAVIATFGTVEHDPESSVWWRL